MASDQKVVILQCAELKESSGLAVSQHDPELIWTHNDSGGKPLLYLFDRSQGALRGLFHFADIKAVDWEDICTFEVGGKRYLAIGDTGDNHRRRKQVNILVVEEPIAPPQSLASSPQTTEDSSPKEPSPMKLTIHSQLVLEVKYPDGAVDCESLVFDSLNCRFLLLTKEMFRCRIFSIPLDTQLIHKLGPGVSTQKISYRADYLQTLSIPLVTAADYCPTSHRLAICTYGPAYLLERNGPVWSERTMKRINLPNRRQGEAIAFADISKLMVTSEFVPTPLWTITIPLNSKEK